MLILPAPAKLNLFLHITGRREDGYHLLQTVFQLLDHGDELRLQRRADGQLQLDGDSAGVSRENNLVMRAARALRETTGCALGASIHLLKRLPAGAGLGGGSSDAATTLLGLNHLWNTGLDLDQLETIGLSLGADVPLFVRGHSAWAEGIGEQLQAITLPEDWFLVIHPGCAVSTAEIFSDPALTRHTRPIKIPAFLGQGGHNDCEPVARRRYPAIDSALRWLSQHAPARMTGTGSCVFARFATASDAQQVLEQLPKAWSGFVARGVNQSPAHTALAATTAAAVD